METPLARQLQLAWLQTQMRKQQPLSSDHPPPSSPASLPTHNHASPSPPSSFSVSPSPFPPSPDPLPHPSQSSSSPSALYRPLPSSWARDADGSWVSAASNSSLPLHAQLSLLPPQHPEEDSFQDPVLQYINDMLMEEDMEDRKCMMQECTSYHATVKEFYDILQGGSKVDFGNGDVLEEQTWNDQHPGMMEYVGNALVDASIVMGDQTLPHHFSGFSPLSSDSTGNFPPQSHESSSQPTALPRHAVFEDVIVVDNNAVTSSSVRNDINVSNMAYAITEESAQHEALSNGLHNIRGSKNQQNKLLRAIPDESKVSANKKPMPNGSALECTLLQKDIAWEEQHSASMRTSVEKPTHTKREDVISYVQNEDLNAEIHARFLNDGGFMFDEARRFSPLSIQQHAGPGSLRPMNMVDLRELLISCAQAVAADDVWRAHEILQVIRQDASPSGTGLQRVAHYFAEGLVARLSGTGGRLYSAFTNNTPSAAKMLKAHHLFVEICPFVKVSHYFANKAILEAAEGASRLHIVDYGILYGLQWPCLISALAERRGGPPVLRITGIDFPQPGFKSAERVEMTGRRLAEYAKTYAVPFEYHAVASKWESVQPSSLHLRQDEVLVVNSMYRLQQLLDETVLASNPRKTVLNRIHSMKPKLFVQGIKNAGYNAPFFMSRFKEALVFFSSKFDMMDTTIESDNQERMMIEREVLGRDILNVVACEGPERIERPETYRQWQNRTQRAGFEQLPLDERVVQKARYIVQTAYHKDFRVEEDGKWMLLGWKEQIMHGLSLWRPASKDMN